MLVPYRGIRSALQLFDLEVDTCRHSTFPCRMAFVTILDQWVDMVSSAGSSLQIFLVNSSIAYSRSDYFYKRKLDYKLQILGYQLFCLMIRHSKHDMTEVHKHSYIGCLC